MLRPQYITLLVFMLSAVSALPALALSYDEIVLLTQAEQKVFGKSDNSHTFGDRLKALELSTLGSERNGNESQRVKAICRKLGMLPAEPEPTVTETPAKKTVEKKAEQKKTERNLAGKSAKPNEPSKADPAKIAELKRTSKVEQVKTTSTSQIVASTDSARTLDAAEYGEEQGRAAKSDSGKASGRTENSGSGKTPEAGLKTSGKPSATGNSASTGSGNASETGEPSGSPGPANLASIFIAMVLGLVALGAGFVIYLFTKAGGNTVRGLENTFEAEGNSEHDARPFPHRGSTGSENTRPELLRSHISPYPHRSKSESNNAPKTELPTPTPVQPLAPVQSPAPVQSTAPVRPLTPPIPASAPAPKPFFSPAPVNPASTPDQKPFFSASQPPAPSNPVSAPPPKPFPVQAPVPAPPAPKPTPLPVQHPASLPASAQTINPNFIAEQAGAESAPAHAQAIAQATPAPAAGHVTAQAQASAAAPATAPAPAIAPAPSPVLERVATNAPAPPKVQTRSPSATAAAEPADTRYSVCRNCGRPYTGTNCVKCTQTSIAIHHFAEESLFGIPEELSSTTEANPEQKSAPVPASGPALASIPPQASAPASAPAPAPAPAPAQSSKTESEVISSLSAAIMQEAQNSSSQEAPGMPVLRSHVSPPPDKSMPRAAAIPSSLHSYMKHVPDKPAQAVTDSDEGAAGPTPNVIKTVENFRQEQNSKPLQFKLCRECDASYSLDAKFCINDGEALQVAEMDPAVAFAFGERYEIESVIASGGMSVLYQAKHKMLNKEVAIKVMDARLVRNSSLVKRFQREAQMICRMNHPNVIVVHDFGTTNNGQPYIVMDFLAGKTLSDILDEVTQLPWHRAKNIFLQVASGLGHAHQLGVTHRDVKPTNIIVDTNEFGGDQVTIVDFGIAKMGAETTKTTRERLTQFGELFGTTMYMSPEQCRGQDVDLRTDIYSLGCVMFEVLCGLPPFNTGDDFEMRKMIVSTAPPLLSERRPDIHIPVECEAVLKKTLEKDREARYQSMDELMIDLAKISD